MHLIRHCFVLLSALGLAGVLGCSPANTKNVQTFLDKISHSPESELPALLYGYDQSSPGAQKVLLGMLLPLRAPSAQEHITIEAVRQSGRFTMVAARVPWPRGTEPAGLQPIIITGEPGHEQVVGYVSPFNDIFPLMKGADMQSVTELSQWWIHNYSQRRGA